MPNLWVWSSGKNIDAGVHSLHSRLGSALSICRTLQGGEYQNLSLFICKMGIIFSLLGILRNMCVNSLKT